jgi:hypothetical protein
MSGSVETQARAFADEVRGGALEAKNWMLDLGHPLLNRIAESFVKAAGVSTPARLCPLRLLPEMIYFPSTSLLNSVPLLLPCGCADRRSASSSEGVVLHGHRRRGRIGVRRHRLQETLVPGTEW